MSGIAQEIAAPTIPGPIAETREPKLGLPPGSCDCHAHIFGPQSRYRYAPKRRYTPPDATLDNYIRMLKTIGVERAVLVQASVYMTDNSAILDALAKKRFALRAVVAVNDSVTDAELARMNALVDSRRAGAQKGSGGQSGTPVPILISTKGVST